MLKGGETNSFLEFLLRSLLAGQGGKLGDNGASVLAAGENLMVLLDLIRKHSKAMPAPAIQLLYQKTPSNTF